MSITGASAMTVLSRWEQESIMFVGAALAICTSAFYVDELDEHEARRLVDDVKEMLFFARERVHHNCKAVVEAMIDEFERGIVPSPKTVASALLSEGMFDDMKEAVKTMMEWASNAATACASITELHAVCKSSLAKVREAYAEISAVERLNKAISLGALKHIELVEEALAILHDAKNLSQGQTLLDVVHNDVANQHGFVVHRPFPTPAGVLGVVAGMGSVGKSFICLLVAMSAASLGKKVFYVSLEDPVEQLASRVQFLTSRWAEDDEHKVIDNPFKCADEIMANIEVCEMDPEPLFTRDMQMSVFALRLQERLVTAATRADLIIVDPIAGLFLNENDNAYVSAVMRFFNQMVRAHKNRGLTVLLSHHVNKGKLSGLNSNDIEDISTMHLVRGASGITNSCKFVVQLFRLSQLEREYAGELATTAGHALGISGNTIACAPTRDRRGFLVLCNTKNNYYRQFSPILISLFPNRFTGDDIMYFSTYDATDDDIDSEVSHDRTSNSTGNNGESKIRDDSGRATGRTNEVELETDETEVGNGTMTEVDIADDVDDYFPF